MKKTNLNEYLLAKYGNKVKNIAKKFTEQKAKYVQQGKK
jgi:hypothetical protein